MKFITPKDAINLLDISDKTIRNWVDEGVLDRHQDDKGNLVLDSRQVLEMKPIFVCFFNQKGGVSKTDSALITMDFYDFVYKMRKETNEKRTKKILIVDLDPQATLSQALFGDFELYGELDEDLDIDIERPKKRKRVEGYLTMYDFFFFNEPLQNIVRHYNEFIDLLPADSLMNPINSVDFLELPKFKKEIYDFAKKNKYSMVLIDTHPDINSLARLGILLSNYVVSPILPTENVYRSLKVTLRTIREVIPHNADFINNTCFLSANKSHRTQIREYVKEKYKKSLEPTNKIFKNTMPDFIGVVERESIKDNMFLRYQNNKSVKDTLDNIMVFMNEFDEMIYS